jgi:hypothetical protein
MGIFHSSGFLGFLRFLGFLGWFPGFLVLGFLGFAGCAPDAATPAAVAHASITRETIEHLTPKRDFVGPMPSRFEWTAVKDVDDYALTIENEVDLLFFNARLRATSLEWPKGKPLEPGTYFWRVVGLAADGRRMADSGRAAFVVIKDPE